MSIYNDLENDLKNDFMLVLEEIEDDLKDKFSQEFNIFNEELNITSYWNLEKDFTNLIAEEKIDIFIKTIQKLGPSFLRYLFSFIQKFEHKSDYLINTLLPMSYEDYLSIEEIPLHSVETIKNYDIVTSVHYPYITWIEPNSNQEEELNNFKLEIENFNNFNNDVYINGLFKSEVCYGYILDTFDSYDLFLNFEFYGVESQNELYDFLIYLIESFFYLESSNYKMALFSIYSSYDGFIQKLYNMMFDYYIENYNYYLQHYMDYVTDTLEDYDINSDTILNNQKRKIDLHLKSKIKLYSNDNRKLNEKVNSILIDLGIKFKDADNKYKYKKQYQYLSKQISLVKEISSHRNSISHGDTYTPIEEDKLLMIFYSILSIFHAFTTGENFIDIFN